MSKEIRSTPALLAPFASIARDVRELFRNPLAFVGGLVGAGITIAGLVLAYTVAQEASAAEPEADALEMEFVPGELVRKGPKIEEQDLPEKIIVKETVAAESAAPDAVTKEEQPVPKPPEDKPPKETPIKSTERPDPNKHNAEVGKVNQDSNTPYDDLPTVEQLPGDPFAGPGGWSDRYKEGDPWATDVIKALNGLKLPAFAGQGKAGSVEFQITICKDGRIETTKVKATDGIDKKVFENEVTRIKLPPPPADVAKQLAKGCKKIPYRFTWTSTGGNTGKVR